MSDADADNFIIRRRPVSSSWKGSSTLELPPSYRIYECTIAFTVCTWLQLLTHDKTCHHIKDRLLSDFFEPGFGAYQSLAQKIKAPFSMIFFVFLLHFWGFEGDFKTRAKPQHAPNSGWNAFRCCKPCKSTRKQMSEITPWKALTDSTLSICLSFSLSLPHLAWPFSQKENPPPKNPPQIKKFVWTSFSEQFLLGSGLVSQGSSEKFAGTFWKS